MTVDTLTSPISTDILYKQLRNLPVIHSPAYLSYLKEKFPGQDLHHITGSQGSVKLNDLLIIPIASRTVHNEVADKHRQIFCVNNLAASIGLLQEFTMKLLR